MKKSVLCFSLLLTLISGNALADDGAIHGTMQKLGIKVESIKPSPIVGLNTIVTEQGIIYLSDDGKYLLQGPIYDVSGSSPVNVSNQLLMKKLEAMKDQMIVYKAPEEKHVVTVFTDITCGYCHKLHENMKEYNKLGITVRYLAFPRQGMKHKSAEEMQSIWCSATPQKSLDAAFKGNDISPIKGCKVNIANHYKLGLQFGVQGTPAIILKDGNLLGGYMPPEALAKTLDQSGK
ncbi:MULTISPECIES: bifunctional protein-disulfide isomerase/oxidoreductase DsbC [Photorhabdus]|uniref:Thiol:disulfide interchange protein n=2 Tax=Photorhabdus asymbiotica TaxID=291112 RepID=B6VKD1_PHOAA|nr:bifunctional protein-disulfide isomerase/oxidoreductase DsbC [Photorhabdus asymbiotica]RKS66734.1 thiol:disulfide interchange protein DsbC [Photorhabdus asymbiotica]CAQ83304.1 thiol:disulfide interchange protein dsbc precursor [Photorhabdus asymbiotica]CAR66611.1 thiol:disulfide interchange protein dsbc precursor [Photorhabdus asymbiotica subsp. asymbiotica ATCC 43949]